MTVAVAVSQISFTWSGSSDWISLGVQMAAAADVRLRRLDAGNRVTLVAGVHFETRLDAASLLCVRMIAENLPAPPFTVVALRVTPALQPSIFGDYVPFDGKTIEHRFDEGALRDAELRRDADDVDARTAIVEVEAAALDGRAGALEGLYGAISARLGVVEMKTVTGSTNPTGQVTLTSPIFVGAPTAPTQPSGDSTTKLATTEFVTRALPSYAYLRRSDLPTPAPPEALRYVEWGNNNRLLFLNSPSYGWQPIEAPLIRGEDQFGRWCMGIPDAWHGLDLQYYGSTQLLLQPGAWNASTPHKMFGFDAGILFNPTATVGLNGCDMNYSGGSTVMNAGWYYVYLLGKSAAPFNDTKVILSKAISLVTVRGNLNTNVAAASAYDFIRKYPVAVYFDGTQFRPFRLSGGWPYPCVSYVGGSMADAGAFISGGTYPSETTINVANWAPDNGRLIELAISIVSGGVAGDAYIRTPGVPGTGLIMPVSANAGDKRSYPYLKIQASSNRDLLIKTPAAAQATASVIGFWCSEQS